MKSIAQIAMIVLFLSLFLFQQNIVLAAGTPPQVIRVDLDRASSAGAYLVVGDGILNNGDGVWINPQGSSGNSTTGPTGIAGTPFPPYWGGVNGCPASMRQYADHLYGQSLFSVSSSCSSPSVCPFMTELNSIYTNMPANANAALHGATGPVNKANVELSRAIPAGTQVTFTINMNGKIPHIIYVTGGSFPVVTYNSTGSGTLSIQTTTFVTTTNSNRSFSSIIAFGIVTDPQFGSTPLGLILQSNHWMGDHFPILPNDFGSGGTFGTQSAKIGVGMDTLPGASRDARFFIPDDAISRLFGGGFTNNDLTFFLDNQPLPFGPVFNHNAYNFGKNGTLIYEPMVFDGSKTEVAVGVMETQQPALSVTPAIRNVSKEASTATFNVSNTGTGVMSWTASVISGGEWLSIPSGNSGSDTGTITCDYTANTGESSRTGTIRVTATGATGSPADVTVTQAGNLNSENDYYVSKNGNDATGDGSSENPWQTIQYGVNQIYVKNANLYVLPGVYEEQVVIQLVAEGLHLIGAGKDITTIDASGISKNGGAIRISSGTGYVISGFTITGGTFEGYSGPGGGVRAHDATVVLEDNIITDNYSYSGDDTGGGASVGPNSIVRNNIFSENSTRYATGALGMKAGTLVENNIFENNRTGQSGRGTIQAYDESVIVRRNIFRNNRCGTGGAFYGIATLVNNLIVDNTVFDSNYVGLSDGYGAAIFALGGIYINNTFANNSIDPPQANYGAAFFCYGNSYERTTPIILKNNIIYGTTGGGGVFREENAEVTADFNVFWGNEYNPYCGHAIPGDHDVQADPLFLDSGSGDYHLSSTSPCIDVGFFETISDIDIDGEKRPMGAGADIGADEYFDIDNQSPLLPSGPSPIDSISDISIGGTLLTWSGGDPDASDTVVYDIYFGTDPAPPLVASGLTSASYASGEMTYSTDYYWQIVARDSYWMETSGPVWHFTTECEVKTFYADMDGDTYGDVNNPVEVCVQPENYVTDSTDCNDDDNSIYPGAPDTWYDGIDSNCDGADDYDQDGDGYRSSEHGGNDCNDLNQSIHPNATDTWYDGEDTNCDGADDYDQDEDGYRSSQYGGTDCNDMNQSIHPDATDTWYDGEDTNCDGADDYDQDGDGYRSSEYGGTDCNDMNQSIHPDAEEIPNDGIDSDCDGVEKYDQDGDGVNDEEDQCPGQDDTIDTDQDGIPDCRDNLPDKPIEMGDINNDDAVDISDAIIGLQVVAGIHNLNAWVQADVNKDLQLGIEESVYALQFEAGFYADRDGDGFTFIRDCDDTRNNVYPGAPEICGDGIDQDCNGVDLSCLDVDNDGDNYTENQGDCDDTNANIYPGAPEICSDGIDQDCSGEDLSCLDVDNDGDNYTENQGDCDDTNKNVYPGASEICGDGIDQDCDGEDKVCPPCSVTCSSGCYTMSWGLTCESGPSTSTEECSYQWFGSKYIETCDGTATFTNSGHTYNYHIVYNWVSCTISVNVDGVGSCSD